MGDNVSKLLSRIDTSNLRVLPRILVDIINEIQREDVEVENLVKIIGQDASLSSRILSVVNSPCYRQWGELTDLKRIIGVLGLSALKTIVISVAIHQFFAKIPEQHQSFLELIWYRSLHCAHIARNLAELTAYPFPDEAYLTGLLHRLGQLILLDCFEKEYPKFLTDHFDDLDDYSERACFGVSQAEVGAHLIASWKLRSFMADAVSYQQQPFEAIADSAGLVKIINIANQLSRLNEDNKNHVYEQVFSCFGLQPELLEKMLDDIDMLVEQSAGVMGITIANPLQKNIQNLTSQQQRDENHMRLADQVKKFALSSVCQQSLANVSELNALIALIQRDFSILFGFGNVAIYLYRSETNTLEWSAGQVEQDAIWSTIPVNLSSQSLVSKAWLRNRILHSFNIDKSSVERLIDRQICQLLHSDDMLVIPICSANQVLGVIVAGVKISQVKKIKANLYFINLFLDDIGKLMISLLKQSLTDDLLNMQADSQFRAKKLVHEINNPLTVINNYLHLLELKLGEENAREVRVIQEEIERVGILLLRLPNSTEQFPDQMQSVDVNQLLMDLIKLFEMGIFKMHHININLALDSALSKISTDQNKLKQIFTNLIKNAGEAMASGGVLDIITKDHVKHNNKDYLAITIADTGPGLPQDVKDHLFSPVASVKGKNHSGLGLTISKRLVDELKGVILCNSSNSGTELTVLLPKLN